MDSYGSVSSEDQNPPRLFINWSIVQQLLQDNTDGAQVQHTLLLKLDGSLLTSSHETPETKAAAEAAAAASASSGPPSLAASPGANGGVLPKILGALVANIWRTAEGNGCAFLQSQALGVMMVECEGGIVAVSRLARFLLCIYAKKTVDRGALRQKMNNLLTHLQPLHRVYAN